MVFRKITLIVLAIHPVRCQATVDCLWFYYVFRHARFYSQIFIMTVLKYYMHLLNVYCCYGNKELGVLYIFIFYIIYSYIHCISCVQIYLISFSNITFWCHCNPFLHQYCRTGVDECVIQRRVFQFMGYISGLWNQFSGL